jgi:DNA-binding beta-propeller fold protein YncE
VAVTADGTRAVVLQGDVYGSAGLLTLDLTTSPATVLDTDTTVKGDTNSFLVVKGNRYAYTTLKNTITVSDFKTGRIKVVKKIRLGTGDGVYALAISPNGKWLYAAHGVVYGEARLEIFKIGHNGVPEKASQLKHQPISGLAVTPDNRHLLLTDSDHHALHVYDLSHDPAHPRKLGESIKLKQAEPTEMAVAADGRYVYVFNAGAVGVAKVDLKTQRMVARRTLATDDFTGDVAVSKDGSQVMVLNGHEGPDDPTVYLLNADLTTARVAMGPCYPTAAASSWSGSTAGRFYLADSGICTDQAMFTPLAQTNP